MVIMTVIIYGHSKIYDNNLKTILYFANKIYLTFYFSTLTQVQPQNISLPPDCDLKKLVM